MFENLSEKLQRVFKNLRGEGKLTAENMETALREIRVALLEADVHFKVVKQLIAILPPAEDTVAAPPVKDPQPLVVRGSIASGDDGLLIASDGKAFVLTLLMFQDAATEDLQNRVKAAKSGTYEARGFRAQGASGGRVFAPSRGRFVYRVP